MVLHILPFMDLENSSPTIIIFYTFVQTKELNSNSKQHDSDSIYMEITILTVLTVIQKQMD